MPGLTSSTIRVRSYELDMFGHVNHAVYLNYLEQARIEALESVGMPWPDLVRRGLFFNVVHVEIDYRREARLGDTLRITTEVEKLGNTSITLTQRVLMAAGAGAGPSAQPHAGNGGTGETAGASDSPTADPPAAAPESSAEPLVAEARVVGVLVGREGRPIPLPDEMRAALS